MRTSLNPAKRVSRIHCNPLNYVNQSMPEHQIAGAEDDIEVVHLAYFLKQLPMILVGQSIAALVVAVLIIGRLSNEIILAWLGVFMAVVFIRVLMYFHQTAHPGTINNRANRVFWHLSAVAILSSLWGGLAFTLLDNNQQLESLIIVMVLLGLVAGSVGSASNLRPMFLVCSSLTVLPAVVKFFLLDQAQYTFIGFLLLSFIFIVSEFEKRVYQSLTESIQLRFKNVKLIENITQEKVRAQDSQRNAEQSLRAAETANVAKSQFLAAASHDLRQPLHALRLLSSTLENTPLTSQQEPLVGNISSSVKSLEELLNSLLDVSKLDAGTQTVDCKTIYLSDVFNNLNRNYAAVSAEKGIQLKIEETEIIIRTDVILLERLLSNLVGNAVRYTAKGEIEISTENQSNRCVIKIKDTGIGISTEDQERIFDEFVQLDNPERDRSKGIGLGLAIVKRTAELLNLPLHIDSIIGKGTTFTLSVPIGDSVELDNVELPRKPTLEHLDGMLILVIDDELSVRNAVEGLLDSWGCLSLTASNGDEAERVIREVDTKPDAIIADLRLRDNETGVDVIHRINKLFQSPSPVIIMTGDIDPNSLRALQTTQYPILHKPCDPQVLLDYMAEIYSNKKQNAHEVVSEEKISSPKLITSEKSLKVIADDKAAQ